MSNQDLLQKVTTLKELKVMAEELADQISAIEGEIKDEMTAQGTDKLLLGAFKVTWTKYTSTRLDSKAIKADLPDIWKRYSVTTEARRFSVA